MSKTRLFRRMQSGTKVRVQLLAPIKYTIVCVCVCIHVSLIPQMFITPTVKSADQILALPGATVINVNSSRCARQTSPRLEQKNPSIELFYRSLAAGI